MLSSKNGMSKQSEIHALTNVQAALGLIKYVSYFPKWTVLNLEIKSQKKTVGDDRPFRKNDCCAM
jgi:hypothetical protein